MPQRVIDLAAWPRRPHFEHFRGYLIPHACLAARVDVTDLRAAAKADGASLFATLLHAACRAANAVPELRQRIRGDAVVEHDVVHPSFTVAGPDDTFSYCHGVYDPDRATFLRNVAAARDALAGRATVAEAPGDDRLYVTSLPWLDFLNIQHPQRAPADSVPRIAWGKVVAVGDRFETTLSIQAHHALADGVHLARFFEAFGG